MNYKFFGRSIGISTLKSIVYIILAIIGILFLASQLPPMLYLAIFYLLFFINTFLFSEWIFRKQDVRTLEVVSVIVITYIWDVLFISMFFTWLVDINIFAQQDAVQHLIFGTMHAIAMYAVYYIRKRFAAKSGLAEGLEA